MKVFEFYYLNVSEERNRRSTTCTIHLDIITCLQCNGRIVYSCQKESVFFPLPRFLPTFVSYFSSLDFDPMHGTIPSFSMRNLFRNGMDSYFYPILV